MTLKKFCRQYCPFCLKKCTSLKKFSKKILYLKNSDRKRWGRVIANGSFGILLARNFFGLKTAKTKLVLIHYFTNNHLRVK